MGTIYIDRRGTRLQFDRGAVVIREPDAKPVGIPLSHIERMVIVGNAQLSSHLLTRLAQNGSSVTLMPARGAQRGTFLQNHGHGDVARRIGQFRLATDEATQACWAKRFVLIRIAGQRRLLRSALRARADLRHPLIVALRDLEAARQALDTSHRAIQEIRGWEGAATAAFFRGYRHLFAASLGFTKRNRRPPKDPVNAALSLAYTLIHADALRAIAKTGLEPMIGVLHQPTFGRDSLACDLTEVARARAERLVWRLFADQTLEQRSFSKTQNAVLLGKAGRSSFFRAYENNAWLHRRWLMRIAQGFARECQSFPNGNGIAIPLEEVDGGA